jgi:hypothetical protein
MTQQQYDAAAAKLERLQQRVEEWRETRAKKSPMPPELWEEAAALARALGVNAVKTALRVNYGSLRQRARPDPVPAFAETPAFVRLDMAQTFGAMGAVVELSDAAGTRLKIQLPAASVIDVARMIEAFRGARS